MTAPGHPTKSSADRHTTLLPVIPAESGTYYLHLMLSVPLKIQVGRFGIFQFEAGNYFYCGSALGPGGVKARLSRHLVGNGKLHWHIDWLRKVSFVVGAGYRLGTPGLECEWSHELARLPGAVIPVPGFGASV
jgi:Uri superfamily endonuclease